MTKGYEVLAMLIPQGGWVISGDNYEDIQFLECSPITKEEFEAGFAQVESDKAYNAQIKAEAKAGLLARLGITAEEAELLLS
jgi:hypothetical protein